MRPKIVGSRVETPFIPHTAQMETSLQNELERTKQDRDEFVKEFSEADYNDIISGWQVSRARKSGSLP